jgi:hypothetical protein
MKIHYVREYQCPNKGCLKHPIQVTHTTDTKDAWCSHCGDYLDFIRDVSQYETIKKDKEMKYRLVTLEYSLLKDEWVVEFNDVPYDQPRYYSVPSPDGFYFYPVSMYPTTMHDRNALHELWQCVAKDRESVAEKARQRVDSLNETVSKQLESMKDETF